MHSFTHITSILSLAALIGVADAAVCGAGKYNSGSSGCQYCSPGTYNSDGQNSVNSCTAAQPGDYACGSVQISGVSCYGATSQSSCGAGYYSVGGAGSCTICPAGSFCSSNNQVTPQLCSPGQYQPTPGATQTCPNCPVGTYNWINGATACCPCCAGTYNDQVSQTHCFSCSEHTNPQVYYSPVGATSVNQCQATAIAGVSNNPAACKDTPSGSTSPAPGTATCPATQSGVPPSTSHVNRRSTMPKICPHGSQRCFHYSGVGGFECVDIRNDPESCGGCVGGDDDEGQDCTAIPDVSVVRCRQKKCVIESCRRGFRKTEKGESCEPILRSLKVQSRRSHGHF